ncbi:hypothetical protein AAVH_17169, partial [Aphelenchoides avenae]
MGYLFVAFFLVLHLNQASPQKIFPDAPGGPKWGAVGAPPTEGPDGGDDVDVGYEGSSRLFYRDKKSGKV